MDGSNLKMSKVGRWLLPFLIVTLIGSYSYAKDILEVRALYINGVQALANNDLDKAEESFKSIISLPDSKTEKELKIYKSKSYYFLGDVYFMRRNYSKAIEYYRVVVQDYAGYSIHSKTLYKLGRTLILEGKYGQGIAVLNEYLGKYSDRDRLGDNALYWVGRAYVGQKDYQLALNTFQSVLTRYPSTALAYDIRSFITKLEKILEEEQKAREAQRPVVSTNELQLLAQKNAQLLKEKEVLEKISELLIIKQRLLEIKSEKLELLNDIRIKGGRE